MNTFKNIKKCKIEWPKDAVVTLIEAWEQNECLYNPKSEFYHNKHARNDALQKMARELQEKIPEITSNEIKTKINYLRTQYCRELTKVKDSYKSGSGYEEIYTPTAYWFDKLNFLKGYINVKKGVSSVPVVIDVDVLNDFEESQPFSTPPLVKKKTTKNVTADIAPEDEILLQAKDLLEKVVQPCSISNRYNEALLLFLQENLCDITDPTLKDELSEEIIPIVMQFKRKQRLLSKLD